MVVGMASMVVMMASILPGPDGALRRCPGEGRRSVGERQGDGFAETMRQARASPELPTHGGDRTHIVVTRNCHDLRTGIGTACLDVVGDITAAETRLLARDCCVIPRAGIVDPSIWWDGLRARARSRGFFAAA
jgi:hypothetical protein